MSNVPSPLNHAPERILLWVGSCRKLIKLKLKITSLPDTAQKREFYFQLFKCVKYEGAVRSLPTKGIPAIIVFGLLRIYYSKKVK